MSKLRRTVRNAIKSGSTTYAKVEEVHFGLATVRLGGSGRRMTNLSILGGNVQPNDIVTVDWSAGINPVVRPLFLEEEEELPPGESVAENLVEDEDIGANEDTYYSYYCSITHGGFLWDEGEGDAQRLYQWSGVPFVQWGGMYCPGEDPYDGYGDWWGEYMDTSDIIDTSKPFSIPGYMVIPKSGKYLINFQWIENFDNSFLDEWSQYHHNGTESSCYYRIRILKNDTECIGIGHGLWGLQYNGATCCTIMTCEYLEAGDRLSFETYYESSVEPCIWIDSYWDYPYQKRARWIQYIPGT